MKTLTLERLKHFAAVLLAVLLCLTLLPANALALEGENTSDLSYTNNRDDYANLSDEEFANFRVVNTTGMRENILYRTSSPINPALGRNTYADAAMKKAGVTVAVNIAESLLDERDYEGYKDTYYYKSTSHAAYDLGTSYSSDTFKAKLVLALTHIANKEGVYAITCSDGYERTGVVVALLECLMGASYDEVVDDYMTSAYNYYGITPEDARYEELLKQGLIQPLCTILGVSDLANADLAAKTETYLDDIGLSESNLADLKYHLGTSEGEIESVALININTTLDPVNKVKFTAEIDPNAKDTDGVLLKDKFQITNESWISGTATIKSKEGTEVPRVGRDYDYEITLEAKDGWRFNESLLPSDIPFTFTVDGVKRTHDDGLKVVVLPTETKKAIITDAVDSVHVNPVDITNASETGIKNVRYTGKEDTVKPVVKATVNGTTVTLVEGTDYTTAVKPEAPKAIGQYTVTLTGQDKFTGTITKTFKITKGVNPIKVKAKTVTLKYSKVKKKSQKVAAKTAFTVSSAQGKVTYKKVSGNKKITVAKNGKITVKKKLKKGTYKVKVKVTAAGNANYAAGSKTVTVKIKVK